MAVLGSFTAGEIARSAMSTICKTPNSMSCWSVRVGPMSKAPRSSALRRGVRRILIVGALSYFPVLALGPIVEHVARRPGP
jgi:hypothetical protein